MAWMPAGIETAEEIQESIAEIDELLRQYGIEETIYDVGIPESIELVEGVKPFERIAVKYAVILASGVMHRVDTTMFAAYREAAEMLTRSEDVLYGAVGTGALCMLSIMETVNAAIDKGTEDTVNVPDMVRRAYMCVELMRT